MTREQAELVVEAVMRSLHTRRPFKFDLAAMPQVAMQWMLDEMCEAVMKAVNSDEK